MHLLILSLVVTPTGPLYIAINTSRTINCSFPDEGYFFAWGVVFQNSNLLNAYTVPGSKIIINTDTSSSLTINTMDTSIIGIQCIGILDFTPGPETRIRINLTIYGMLIL